MKRGMLLILIAILFVNCNRYTIKSRLTIDDQKKKGYSLVVGKITLPNSSYSQAGKHRVTKVGLVNVKQRKEYENIYVPSKFNAESYVVENVPQGKYFFARFYSKAKRKVGNMLYWSNLKLKLMNPKKVDKNQSHINIEGNKIIYLGKLSFYEEKSKKSLIRVIKKFGKTEKDLDKATLYKTKIYLKNNNRSKPYLIVRVDHPNLIGKRSSLIEERNVLNDIFSEIQNIPHWKKMVKKRLKKLKKQIALLKDDSKTKNYNREK